MATIENDEVLNVLNAFLKKVITESRKNLTRKGVNASKSLYNSLQSDVQVFPNSFSASISMEDYGKFIDKGVKGKGGRKKSGGTWKNKAASTTPFRFKDKRPPARVFNIWSVRRGLAPRDPQGRFIPRRSLQFALAEAVYRQGIETTNFFTAPFEQAFLTLPDELTEAYGLEVDQFLEFVINK